MKNNSRTKAAKAKESNGETVRVPRSERRSITQHVKFSPIEWDLLGQIALAMFQPSRYAALRALVLQEAEKRGLRNASALIEKGASE
jgi:hypothetical protein